MLRSWFAAVAVTGVWLATASVSTAQVCGDCDADNRVTIAELVRAVNNSLDNPLAQCGECFTDCFDTPPEQCPCPGACIEFPLRGGIRCAVSMCRYSEQQVVGCVHALHENTDRCVEEPPR